METGKRAKNILIVDDSALMRSVICDIINSDERFHVADRATNGLEALDLIKRNTYDAVVLDVNMPKMSGVELLRELQSQNIAVRIMMLSAETAEGEKLTMDCLELGALDFAHKPDRVSELREGSFQREFLETLYAVSQSSLASFFTKAGGRRKAEAPNLSVISPVGRPIAYRTCRQIVAIACSTGGPKALQSVIPKLPGDLPVPVLLVQHMPAGFTASLAQRLDKMSAISVREAQEGDPVEPGCVYISKGGAHMNVVSRGGVCVVHYSDEPIREGVKPCANYMYESLRNCPYDHVVCAVLTGMGADGTKGIAALKEVKKIYTIVQDEKTCAVYGMPKSVVSAGLADEIVSLENIAREITVNLGVK